MRRVTEQESEQIRTLQLRLGSVRFRTLMTADNRRLMRPERLLNLESGKGRISDSEARQLKKIKTNSNKLVGLGKKETIREKKGRKRNEAEVNRKMRDWLNYGKVKGQAPRNPEMSWKAFNSLDYFAIEDLETYYIVEVD